MITQDRPGGEYIASCDRCGRTFNTGLRSMQQAANCLSRSEGWDSWKQRGVWKNYCPGCVEAGEPDPDLDRAGIGFVLKPGFDD
jgi:hypothetical protein